MMQTLNNICRTCLKSTLELTPLFNDMSLPRKIRAISSVKVSEGDDLPSTICSQCVVNINSAFDYRQTLIDSDTKLKKRVGKSGRHLSSKAEEQGFLLAFEDEHVETLSVIKAEIIDCTPDQSYPSVDYSSSTAKVEVPSPERSSSPVYDDRYIQDRASNIKVELVTKCETQNSPVCSAKADKNVLCHYCGKQVLQSNLSKHVLIHTEAPVCCKICGKMAKNTVSLRSHMDMHNPPTRTCEYCGKSFKFRSNYIEHINRHTGNKKHKCTLCDKLFLRSNTLKKHKLTHTGERPHSCEYCKKGFSSRYALKTHVRQHTNEKPYVCDYCPMGFPQKVSLKTHIKAKHSEMANT